jgi:hypothetical protein
MARPSNFPRYSWKRANLDLPPFICRQILHLLTATFYPVEAKIRFDLERNHMNAKLEFKTIMAYTDQLIR